MTPHLSSIIPKISENLTHSLPGALAQNRMSPIVDHEKYRTVPEDHRVACVMAIVHKKNNESLWLTYIKRAASHPADKHAGQIGFPGGKYELEDNSLLDCALREVHEEIGIAPHGITILGQLSPLYVYASNFLVYPFVGYLDHIPSYIPQIEEVSDVLEIPLSSIVDESLKTKNKVLISDGYHMKVPGYNINNHFLWGATAMITSELEEVYLRSIRNNDS